MRVVTLIITTPGEKWCYADVCSDYATSDEIYFGSAYWDDAILIADEAQNHWDKEDEAEYVRIVNAIRTLDATIPGEQVIASNVTAYVYHNEH